ncbi:MAG: TetR family transcriptional regulator [Deltaproteobacteria bacterium]|nr:TetR family transcriptional regulator [Deltaproteobacteria bacterium]
MVIKTRARSEAAKEKRLQTLLQVARPLVAAKSFDDLKMAEVAEAAGVAKGTVFLYFPTKEALCLALLEAELHDWLADLGAQLEQPGRWSEKRLARAFVETLSPRPLFLKLLGLLSTVLEHNLPLPTVVAFKERLLLALVEHGALLERRLPKLSPGEGARLLLRVDAVVVGLSQLASPSPVVAQALALPHLQSLVVDFEPELLATLTALFVGYAD